MGRKKKEEIKKEKIKETIKDTPIAPIETPKTNAAGEPFIQEPK